MLSCGDNKDLPEDYYDVDRNREELYEDILKDSNILLDYDDYLYENLTCSLVIEIIDKNYPKPENNPAFKSYELNDRDFYDLEKVPEEIKNQVIATVYYRTKLLTSDTMYEFCDLSQMDEWGDDYLSRYTDWTFLLWEVGLIRMNYATLVNQCKIYYQQSVIIVKKVTKKSLKSHHRRKISLKNHFYQTEFIGPIAQPG